MILGQEIPSVIQGAARTLAKRCSCAEYKPTTPSVYVRYKPSLHEGKEGVGREGRGGDVEGEGRGDKEGGGGRVVSRNKNHVSGVLR